MAVVNSHKYCDGIRRRDMLSIGSMGLFGSMINLPRVMEAQARAAAEGKPAKDISMILVFLHGGLSTIDTWDMKPDAPAEFRGEFDPKSTVCRGFSYASIFLAWRNSMTNSCLLYTSDAADE